MPAGCNCWVQFSAGLLGWYDNQTWLRWKWPCRNGDLYYGCVSLCHMIRVWFLQNWTSSALSSAPSLKAEGHSIEIRCREPESSSRGIVVGWPETCHASLGGPRLVVHAHEPLFKGLGGNIVWQCLAWISLFMCSTVIHCPFFWAKFWPIP